MTFQENLIYPDGQNHGVEPLGCASSSMSTAAKVQPSPVINIGREFLPLLASGDFSDSIPGYARADHRPFVMARAIRSIQPPETRRKVLKVIKAQGYVPHASARLLAGSDKHELAAQIAENLIAAIESKRTVNREIEIPVRLILRGSAPRLVQAVCRQDGPAC
jgi:hypothetical protein